MSKKKQKRIGLEVGNDTKYNIIPEYPMIYLYFLSQPIVTKRRRTMRNDQDLKINIAPIDNYWIATISDKKGKPVKEFLGHDKEFTQWKANFFVFFIAGQQPANVKKHALVSQV